MRKVFSVSLLILLAALLCSAAACRSVEVPVFANAAPSVEAPTATPLPTPVPTPEPTPIHVLVSTPSPEPSPTEPPISCLRTDLDPTAPMVALTFDDGPSGKTTSKILDLLSEYGGRATFCMVGERMEEYSDVVKRAAAGGNEIACHTWSHARLVKKSREDADAEIGDMNDKVLEMTDLEVRFLRPPYGGYNNTVKEICVERGLSIVYWSVDTNDWQTKDASSTFGAIKRRAADGAIILCHDLYSATGSAMEDAIPWLTEQGFQLVTLTELLYYKNGGAVPGTVYKSASDYEAYQE